MKYVQYLVETGEIIGAGSCSDSAVPPGTWIEVEELPTTQMYVQNGTLVEVPISPGVHYIFNWATKQWYDPRTLQDLKDTKWEEIKLARAAAKIAPTLITRFGVFDADTEGVENMKDTVIGLNEAAKIGMAPESITWTLADNSLATLTPLELAEVSAMLLTRGNAAFTRARELRNLIYSSETDTPEKVDAITW